MAPLNPAPNNMKMNPFEPASLSPIPKTPVACSLPYDLTSDNLWSILPGLEDRAVTSSYLKLTLTDLKYD